MDDWKNYVGYTEVNINPAGDDVFKFFYLKAQFNPDGSVAAYRIEEQEFTLDQLTLSEDEVGDEVEKILEEFPVKYLDNAIDIMRARNQVAKDSRRGIASTNYGNIWYYKGSHNFDSPIMVIGGGDVDKYMVWKHPAFFKYGFIATTSPEEE